MTERNKHHTFKADEIPCQEISDPAVLSKNPLVSVKMITYNHAPYIAQAIEGVVKQETEYPFELIIGEDCSTDGTREIVFEFQKKYPDIIRVITSDKNVGMKQNGYRTTKACRGKYIAFCEGDDYWHRSDKLQLQVEYLEMHPECGIIYSDYDRYEVKTGKLIKSYNHYKRKKPPKHPQLIDILRGQCGILTCTVCVRNEQIQQVTESDSVLFSSDRFLMGDTPLWAEISCRANIFYFEESLATYNILQESTTNSRNIVKKYQFWRSNAEMRVYLAKKHNLPPDEIRSYEKHLYDWDIRLAFQQNNRSLGIAARKSLGILTLRQSFFFLGSQNTYLNRLLKASLNAYHYAKRLIGTTSG